MGEGGRQRRRAMHGNRITLSGSSPVMADRNRESENRKDAE
jgi:hypothetical protein